MYLYLSLYIQIFQWGLVAFYFEQCICLGSHLILLHSERPKLYAILAFLSAIGLSTRIKFQQLLLCYCFTSMVNSYDHVGTVR